MKQWVITYADKSAVKIDALTVNEAISKSEPGKKYMIVSVVSR